MDCSPWPLTTGLGVLSLAISALVFMAGGLPLKGSVVLVLCSLTSLIFSAWLWWRDVTRESTFQGSHTTRVVAGIRWGVILFIASEVMFFFSLFYGWFYIGLSPDPSWGSTLPPAGVQPLKWAGIPLFNTVVLLSSGVSLTWAHHQKMEGQSMSAPLFITCLLGALFLLLQAYEYQEMPFSMSDSAFGSVFFLSTGFHGIHVMIGTTMLVVALLRESRGHFSSSHHTGFEATAWYWHFVDVVWLLLFVSVYWWGF